MATAVRRDTESPSGARTAGIPDEDKVLAAEDELKNPMRLAGLALCGAQRTLDLREKSEVPPADSDGILIAEDVSRLDLKCTRLVTLSACEIGRGEAKA